MQVRFNVHLLSIIDIVERGIEMPALSELDEMQFSYYYVPNSEVFHNKDCHVLLHTLNIVGCETYEKARKHHRPCKLCQPKRPKKPESNQDLIDVRLLDGSFKYTRRGNIVGCCHHNLHPGKMNKRLLLEHNCIGKDCKFFEKYDNAYFWREIESKKKRRLANKKKKVAQRHKLLSVGEELQYYLDLCGYEVDVIEIKEDTPTCFTVFYVSDKPYNDWREYPQFYGTLGYVHPDWRLQMRHIKNEYGQCVTIDEFYAQKRE